MQVRLAHLASHMKLHLYIKNFTRKEWWDLANQASLVDRTDMKRPWNWYEDVASWTAKLLISLVPYLCEKCKAKINYYYWNTYFNNLCNLTFKSEISIPVIPDEIIGMIVFPLFLGLDVKITRITRVKRLMLRCTGKIYF